MSDFDPHDDDRSEQFEVVSTVIRRAPRANRRTRATDHQAQSRPPVPATHAPGTAPAAPPPIEPHRDPIPHLLPHGSIGTFSGASGVGKTTFLAGMVRDLMAGLPFFGHATNAPPMIGYIAADRPWRDSEQWFRRAGVDTEDRESFRYYSLPDDPAFDWDRLRDWKQATAIFNECLDKLSLPPGSLVIADPMPLFIPGRVIDYKDAAIGVRALDSKCIRPRQLTLFGVFHTSKQKTDKNARYLRPQDRILGSGGQVGYSETAFYIMGPDEAGGECTIVGWVPHQLRPESHKLKRTEEGLFRPVDDVELVFDELAAASAIPQDDQTRTTAMLIAILTKACACSQSTAARYLARAAELGHLVKVGRGKWKRAAPETVN